MLLCTSCSLYDVLFCTAFCSTVQTKQQQQFCYLERRSLLLINRNQHKTMLHSLARPKIVTCIYTLNLVSQFRSITNEVPFLPRVPSYKECAHPLQTRSSTQTGERLLKTMHSLNHVVSPSPGQPVPQHLAPNTYWVEFSRSSSSLLPSLQQQDTSMLYPNT